MLKSRIKSFYAEGQLSPAIESVMRNAEEGFVYGPYEEDNSYKLARLTARINDSIQVAIIEITSSGLPVLPTG